MSLASRIVGIPVLEVDRVHRQKGIKIWIKPFHRSFFLYCGNDHLKIRAVDNQAVLHSRQTNRVMTLYLKLRKNHCRDCGRYSWHRTT